MRHSHAPSLLESVYIVRACTHALGYSGKLESSTTIWSVVAAICESHATRCAESHCSAAWLVNGHLPPSGHSASPENYRRGHLPLGLGLVFTLRVKACSRHMNGTKLWARNTCIPIGLFTLCVAWLLSGRARCTCDTEGRGFDSRPRAFS